MIKCQRLEQTTRCVIGVALLLLNLMKHLYSLLKLHEHLLEINYTTYQRLERIMPELTKRAGAAKELKAKFFRFPLAFSGFYAIMEISLEIF